MEILPGIAAVAENYDGFVLDLWGVVHDGRAPYPGVADALVRIVPFTDCVVMVTV